MDENLQLGSVRSTGALFHSKGVCNEIFYLSRKLREDRWQADGHGQQQCFSSSSHLKMLKFYHAVFDKFCLGKGQRDFATSAATIKLANTFIIYI